MNEDILLNGVQTVEQAKKLARKYAKKNNLMLGEFEKDVKAPLGSAYCFAASDPKLEGMIVGLPLHVCVDETTGTAYSDRFM